MAEKKVLSTVTKTLLKNVIRHTDSHNKVVEEGEMWRQREKEVSSRGRGSDYSFLKDRGSDMSWEYPSRRDRRAHMDDEEAGSRACMDEEPHSRARMDDEPKSTYWMKQLYKAEEADKQRWGHSGFKELYPEHFSSTDYSSSSDEASHRKHKKRKKSSGDHRKSRKRKHSDSESDSEDEKPRKHKKKHKHKDKKKHKKSKHKKKKCKRASSESS